MLCRNISNNLHRVCDSMHTGRRGNNFHPSNMPQILPVPFIGGLSVTFGLGATSSLEGAIVKITQLPVAVEKILPASISTQVAILRRLLAEEYSE